MKLFETVTWGIAPIFDFTTHENLTQTEGEGLQLVDSDNMRTKNKKVKCVFYLILILLSITFISSIVNSETYTTHFRVTNKDGTPIEDADIEIDGRTQITDIDGIANFELQSGQYEVKIEHEDYEPETEKIRVSNSRLHLYTLTEKSEASNDDLFSQIFNSDLFLPILIAFVFLFGLIVAFIIGNRKIKKGGKKTALSIFAIIIILLATISHCGCLESVPEKVPSLEYDGNPLFCGEDKWFTTTLDFEVNIKTFDSYCGPPRRPEEAPDNKATKQLYSKYKISIVPVDPNSGSKTDSFRSGLGDPDSNSDGIPDGYQANSEIAWGVDGILQSIPQACNGQGYQGRLYNGISRKNLKYAADILPQSEKRSGFRVSESDDKGIIEDIFIGTMDRPFITMPYNFQDNFLDEVVYIAVPIIIHITAESRAGYEIFSTDISTPLFIHLPKPGQDQSVRDYVYLEVFTPLNWRGGGRVILEAEGTEVEGTGWINIKSDSTILSQVYQNWKKQMESAAEAMIMALCAGILGGIVIGLVVLVILMLLIWNKLTDIGDDGVGDFVFIPGAEWKFNKGELEGKREWGYRILPEAVEGTGGGAT